MHAVVLKLKLTSVRVSVKCSGYIECVCAFPSEYYYYLLSASMDWSKIRFGSVVPHTSTRTDEHGQCWRFCLFNNMILWCTHSHLPVQQFIVSILTSCAHCVWGARVSVWPSDWQMLNGNLKMANTHDVMWATSALDLSMHSEQGVKQY